MASPKALILQGILGVAGLCASSAAGVGLSLDKAFGGVKGDAPGDNSSVLPEASKTIKVVDVNDDLEIPKECDTTCVLTAEQLKKLKFEQKGDEEIKHEGLEDSDEFELLIEVSEDETNYPKGKKYTLKPKTISGQVTIKGIKEGDIVLGKDQEVLIREISSGKKLEHLLEEVTELGIPKRCVGEHATQTCELTKLQLQKLKFEARKGEAVKVEGQNEGNIVTLKIEDKGDDLNNYPKGKKYTLTSTSGDVTIKNVVSGDITIGAEGVLIREKKEGGKLEHLLEELNELGIPKRCVGDQAAKPCDLKEKQLKDLKFEPKEGSSITVKGQSDNSKFELIIEDKPNDRNYPKGKKYKIQSKGTEATIRGVKDGDIVVWENQSVVIRETGGGGKLEMAPEEIDELGIPRECKKSCSLTERQLKKLQFETRGNEEIKVEGLETGNVVTLKVEDKQGDTDNYPKGKKYILSTKSEQQVTIKGINGGDITIEKRGDVVIREKQNERKLEIAPEEIDHLRIPRRCNTGATCHLTKEEFQRIKFEERSGSSISIDGLDDGNKVDLKVETAGDINNYPKGKKYTFTSKSGTVTIQNAKDKDIVLKENKAVDFREITAGKKLETYLDVLGIPRPWGGENIRKDSGPQTYLLSSDQVKDLKFENFDEEDGDVKVEGLTDKIKLTISWDEDKSKYPDSRKYSFNNTDNTDKDIKITKGGVEVKIAKKSESRFKNDNGQLVLVEAKDRDQIKRESELSEIKEILKQVGLGELQIGDIVGGNSTNRKQTYIEFKSESDLKKIQLKEFMGGSDYTSSFSGRKKIIVYLDWERDTGKFPKNMKITFENQSFEAPGFEFKKTGKSPVVIYKKELKNGNSKNQKNVFKIEKQGNQDKWYLVRTNV